MRLKIAVVINHQRTVEAEQERKTAKKVLQRSINQLKKQSWKALYSDLHKDIWVAGYKIAVKHLWSLSMPHNPTMDQKWICAENYFLPLTKKDSDGQRYQGNKYHLSQWKSLCQQLKR